MQWYYLAGFIMILIVIGIMIFTGMEIKEREEGGAKELEFISLCSDWNRRYCTARESEWNRIDLGIETGLEQIDSLRKELEKKALGDICIEMFPEEANEEDETGEKKEISEEEKRRRIITCQDVCKNNCLSQLNYDLEVRQLDIGTERDWPTLANVTVRNAGTKTVYDAVVRVWNTDNLSKKPREELIPIFYSQTEQRILNVELPEACAEYPAGAEKCVLCVNITADINEDTGNNEACSWFRVAGETLGMDGENQE